MGKSKTKKEQSGGSPSARPMDTIVEFDPALISLFATSSGPVTIQPRSVQVSKPPVTTAHSTETPVNEASSSGSGSSDLDAGQEVESSSDSEREAGISTDDIQGSHERPRKRRRVANGDDLEESYFRRLDREEEREQSLRRTQRGTTQTLSNPEGSSGEADKADSASSTEDEDDETEQPDLEPIPQHESLQRITNDADKLNRTVFLGNVSAEAIRSKPAKKTLTRHLRSVLKTPAQGKRAGKFESLRFRSTAYVSGSGPKKATFAKKELMDTTTKSTNAYAVFTTVAAAHLVTEKLNGSVVLDRHLRVDSLGQPGQVDYRRCVFVGNLSFVDEETPDEDAKDNQSQPRRPRGKEPADPEEGLWRTFGKVGKVESVRVVRDQETRVSKGFAYVQFYDENSVEGALLLNEKKFPPMLPRKLRVMRAKRMKPKAQSTRTGNSGKENATSFNRREGHGVDRGHKRKRPFGKGSRTGPNALVFEGHRATSANTPKGISGRVKKRLGKRPDTRSSRRGAAFKAAAGRKARSAKASGGKK